MNNKEDSIEFITEIIPEIVHSRCFCDVGSREFIEFDSVSIDKVSHPSEQINDKSKRISDRKIELFRGKIVIKFSDDPKTFFVIIKLLGQQIEEDDDDYKYFLNEEMFYNKMTSEYKLDIYPKVYVADMGRYGRPIIVIEDLEAVSGYRRVDSKLDEDHLRICLKAIARFHARGLRLKYDKFNTFREFYAKLLDTNNIRDYNSHIKFINKIIQYVKEHPDLDKRIIKLFQDDVADYKHETEIRDNEFLTICHGNFNLNNLLFWYENNIPTDVKIIDWGCMKYSLPSLDWQIINISKVGDEIFNGNIKEIFHDYLLVLVDECPGIFDNI
ncbi:EcKinase 9 [Microplitis demolitor]|uniref:uncharacterized LOC103575024 n=1 Tax=Microplitis demolitor TaxID=69319 RepID=UPI0004CDDB27|nr:uncharacterized LOC103575024 [Microplitis demolitor]XP_053598808.1 uncharacterized LOC103575024 isoform X1 [Microplitis demolitor]KAG6558341.1 EcKinase 9 [Microplitis demolitor]